MTKKSKRASKKKKELSELEQSRSVAAAVAAAAAATSSGSASATEHDSAAGDALKEYHRMWEAERGKAKDSEAYDYDATAYSPPRSPPPGSTARHASLHKSQDAGGPGHAEPLQGRNSVSSLAEPIARRSGSLGFAETASATHSHEKTRSPRGEQENKTVVNVADQHLADLELPQGSSWSENAAQTPPIGQAGSHVRPGEDSHGTEHCAQCSQQEQSPNARQQQKQHVQKDRGMHRSDSNSSVGKMQSCRQCKYLQACLDRERLAATQHRQKIEHNNSSMVTLNVGGNVFTTSVSTLASDSGSMLSAMFSGRYAPAKDEHGRYFIDRDGTHFRFVLNFLRDGTVRLPDDLQSLQELMQEAQYYQITGLIKAITEAPRLSKNEYITIRYLPANTYDGWPIRIEGPLEPHIICELHGGVLPPDRETADVRNMYGQPSTGWKVRGVFLTKIFNIIASYGWQLATSNGSGGGKQRNFAEMYVFSRSKLMRRKRLQRKRRSAAYSYKHLFAMPVTDTSAEQLRPAAHGVPRQHPWAPADADGYFSPEDDEMDHMHRSSSAQMPPQAAPAIPVTLAEEPMAILLPVNVEPPTDQYTTG